MAEFTTLDFNGYKIQKYPDGTAKIVLKPDFQYNSKTIEDMKKNSAPFSKIVSVRSTDGSKEIGGFIPSQIGADDTEFLRTMAQATGMAPIATGKENQMELQDKNAADAKLASTTQAQNDNKIGYTDPATAKLSNEKNIPFSVTGQGTFNVSQQDLAKWSADGTIEAWKKDGYLPKDSLDKINNITQAKESAKQELARNNDPNVIKLTGKDGKEYFFTTAELAEYKKNGTLKSWINNGTFRKESVDQLDRFNAGLPVAGVTGKTVETKPVKTGVDSGSLVEVDGGFGLAPDIWSDIGLPLTLATTEEEKLLMQKVMKRFETDPSKETIDSINGELKELAAKGQVSNEFVNKIAEPLKNIDLSNEGIQRLKDASKMGSQVQSKIDKLGNVENPSIANVLDTMAGAERKTSEKINQIQPQTNAGIKGVEAAVNQLDNPYIQQILDSVGGNEFINQLKNLAGTVEGGKTAQQQQLEKVISERLGMSEGDYAKQLFETAANPIKQEAERQNKRREQSLYSRGIGNSTIAENLQSEADRELLNTLSTLSGQSAIQAKQFVNDIINTAITQGQNLQSGIVNQGQQATQIQSGILQGGGSLRQALIDLTAGKAVDAATMQNVMNELKLSGNVQLADQIQKANELNSANAIAAADATGQLQNSLISGAVNVGQLEQGKNELNSQNAVNAAKAQQDLMNAQTQNAATVADVVGQTNQQKLAQGEALSNAVTNQAQVQNQTNQIANQNVAQQADINQQIVDNSIKQNALESSNMNDVLTLINEGENKEIYNQNKVYDEATRRVDQANLVTNQAIAAANGQVPVMNVNADANTNTWKANIDNTVANNNLLGLGANAINQAINQKPEAQPQATVGQVFNLTDKMANGTALGYKWDPVANKWGK